MAAVSMTIGLVTQLPDATASEPLAAPGWAPGDGPARSAGPRPDEVALIERLRAGEEAAFVALIDRYGPTLRRFARLYCTDAVAEEVVQETWIGVLTGLDRFEGRASFRTWLFGILKNVARSRAERERRHVPFSAFEDPTEDREPAVEPSRFRPADDPWPGNWISHPQRWDELPEQRYLSTEGVELAGRAIEALPPAQREVVALRDVDGWSSDEVSEALGISPGNQRVLLHRGRSKVRAALERGLANRPATAEANR